MTDQKNNLVMSEFLKTDIVKMFEGTEERDREADFIKFYYPEDLEGRKKISNIGLVGTGGIVNLVSDNDKNEYYNYQYRKNPERFSITVNVNGKKVTFNYKDADFDDNGNYEKNYKKERKQTEGKYNGEDVEILLNDEVPLFEVEPENAILDDKEKELVCKALANLVSSGLIQFSVNDPQMNSLLNKATRLFKAVVNQLDLKEETNKILMYYINSVNEKTLSYCKTTGLDHKDYASKVYSMFFPELSSGLVFEFNQNRTKFIKEQLDNIDRNDALFTQKIFDTLKEQIKGNLTNGDESFVNYISKENFFKELSPEQCGKLAAIISRLEAFDTKLEPTCKEIATHINKYDKSEIQVFSNNFAKTTNGIFIRDNDQMGHVQMRAADFAGNTFNITKHLDNTVYRDIITSDVYNDMPNFIESDKRTSKLAFSKSLEESYNSINSGIKINDVIKYDATLGFCAKCNTKHDHNNFLKETKDDIKTNEKAGAILSDLICNGKIDKENGIQTYLNGLKNLRLNETEVVKLTIENIYNKEDIYPFVKEALINDIFTNLKEYKNQSVKEKNVIKKMGIKKEIESVRKLTEKIVKKINENPIEFKNENGVTVKLTLDNKKENSILINSFLEKEKNTIKELKNKGAAWVPQVQNDEYKLEKNEKIIKTLYQGDQQSLNKSNNVEISIF